MATMNPQDPPDGNGNGKPNIALLNYKIDVLTQMLKDHLQEQANLESIITVLREGQTERKTQISSITERVNKLEIKSDNWNTLNSIGVFIGSIVAALVGIFVKHSN